VGIRYTFSIGRFNGVFLTAEVRVWNVDLRIGELHVEDRHTGEKVGVEAGAGIENEYVHVSLGARVQFEDERMKE
jgi:hypothetical protein